MKRHFALAVCAVASVTLAQPLRNAAERGRDRQDLRQDRRQLADDRADAARLATLSADYARAMATNDASAILALDGAFQRLIDEELRESRWESTQARQEIREDNREVRSERRELRQRRPGVADDGRDLARDRANRLDDRVDAARERGGRAQLEAIKRELASLPGTDAASVQRKRTLYAEVAQLASGEVRRNKEELREDRRELREDRRETREDRRLAPR